MAHTNTKVELEILNKTSEENERKKNRQTNGDRTAKSYYHPQQILLCIVAYQTLNSNKVCNKIAPGVSFQEMICARDEQEPIINQIRIKYV